MIGTPGVRPVEADNSAHGSGASAQLSGRRSRLLAAQLRGLPGQYHLWLFGLDSGATSVAQLVVGGATATSVSSLYLVELLFIVLLDIGTLAIKAGAFSRPEPKGSQFR